jgi:predicted Zn-dependent protease with MMP-like domain
MILCVSLQAKQVQAIMKPMSMNRFCKIVRSVLRELPAEIKLNMKNVVVDVEEEPEPKMLRRSGYTEEEIAAGVDLLGLMAPLLSENIVDLDDEAELHDDFQHDSLDQPNRLIIYKGPHERLYPDPTERVKEIRNTVIHELAHHFGYTEGDLRRWTSVY